MKDDIMEILDGLIRQMDRAALQAPDPDPKYLRNAIMHLRNDVSVLASAVREMRRREVEDPARHSGE